jgi:hypothetical protein
MAKQIQLRRGTTTQISSFTGAAGELIFDTTLNTLTVMDGTTVGGTYMAKSASPTLTGTVTVPSRIDVTGIVTHDADPVSASDINCSQGNYFTKTATTNLTWTFSNVISAKVTIIVLRLTNGGSYAMTWPVSVKWASGVAPGLTATGTDILSFITDDGGTTWRGVASIIDAR